MEQRHSCRNRRKYSLKVHLVFVTKYRRRLFFEPFDQDLKHVIGTIAIREGWSILAMETDKDHIHILLEYDAVQSVSEIVKKLKQQTTFAMWQTYTSVLKRTYWNKKVLWSDGYFACSIGEVSQSTIQRYIDNQG